MPAAKAEVTVSTILPTFNRKELLSQTVQSILAQTHRDLELVIVDNMSSDGTSAYIESLADSRISHYRNENHGVIAVNRNLGIRRARGKYIAFCDDDDLWLPDKLEKQLAVLETYPDVGLCYTDFVAFNGERTTSPPRARCLPSNGHFRRLLLGNYIPNSSVVLRREVFEKLGLINEAPALRATEDYEMWLRVAAHYRVAHVAEPLIRYRVHAHGVAGRRAGHAMRAIRALWGAREKVGMSGVAMLPFIAVQMLKFVWYTVADLRSAGTVFR